MLGNVASYRQILLIFFFLCLSMTIIGTTNATTENKISVSQAIVMDPATSCNVSVNLLQAKHFEKCKKVYLPTTQFNYTVKESDLFSCLALWDRTWKMCSIFKNKIRFSGQSIFASTSVFDAEIDRMFKLNIPQHALDICKNLVVPSDSNMYRKTETFVSQLMDAGNCVSSCYYSESTGLNPLCVAIYRVDIEIEKIKTAFLRLEQPIVDVTTLPPNSQDSIENHGSDEEPSSLESTVPNYHPHHGISSTENTEYDGDKSDASDASDENDDDDSETLDREILLERKKVNNDERDNNSSLIFIMCLAVVGLLCLGYLSCSYKRKISAKQQQAYRGLESSLEYDEYFNSDVNKFEKFYQPTTLPVPK